MVLRLRERTGAASRATPPQVSGYQMVNIVVRVTPDELARLIKYDPQTGRCVWNIRRSGGGRVGSIAGGLDGDGYWRIGIYGRQYLRSHLAWYLTHGEMPKTDIDHIDLCRSNDAIANLRLATRRQNIANSGLRSTNTSGRKGVYWCKQTGKWKARIRDGKRHIYLGIFHDVNDAGAAYERAAIEMYGEFSRLS